MLQIGPVRRQNFPRIREWAMGRKGFDLGVTMAGPKLITRYIFVFSNHRNVLQSYACKGQSDGENIAQDILMRKQLADGQFDADNFWPDIRTGRRLGAI